MSTNFAKTLVSKQDYDVKLWRHKQRTTNTYDYPMSTNFAKTLVWKQDYDVKLWRHKQRTTNTYDYPMPLNETPPMKIFCLRHCRQVRYQKLLFSVVGTQWKMYFFVPSVRLRMHHNYGVISGRHTSTDCLELTTLVAGHCTTCRGERVLVLIKFNITFLPLRLYWDKMCTCFSKDAGSLTTYGCALWCSRIVYIRTYFFDNTTAFYFVTEGPDVPVLVWGHVQATTHSCFTWYWPGLDSIS